MKKLVFTGVFLVFLLAMGCEKDDGTIRPETDWFSEYPAHFPAPMIPSGNEPNATRIELGKALFYDPVLSIDSSISCASCHLADHAFASLTATNPGVYDRPGTRNVPGLFNLAFQPHYLREASVPTLEMQILVPIQEHNEFAHNIVDIGQQLSLNPYYDSLSRLAYGQPPGPYSITRSIAAFERTLVSANSRYDRVITGKSKYTPLEAEGYQIFISSKTNCVKCHSGPFFTTFEPENNGLYLSYKDPGRARFTKQPSDSGKFKVPSLRNVALTPPYMHDGSLASLENVVDHYASGGKSGPNQNPLVKGFTLKPGEKEALIAFLKTLSDPAFTQNPHFRP
jgi:cytochrome c peroxidase